MTFDPLADVPADFGPRIPIEEGVSGLLVVADPEDGCAKLQAPGTASPWVALIIRTQHRSESCTFDIKVANAEAAGASAAIVYDDTFESLIVMAKPYGSPDPGIPAVFVSQRSGVLLKKLLVPGVTTVTITAVPDGIWLSMLMSSFAGFFAVSAVLCTLWLVQQRSANGDGGSAQRRGPQGLSPAQLAALPIIIYDGPGGQAGGGSGGITAASPSPTGQHGGGTCSTCIICLENYEPGEKLRLLPCQHRYHRDCIGQWLGNRRRLCPVCKHDVTQPSDTQAAGRGGAGDAPAVVLSAMGGAWLAWHARLRRAVRGRRPRPQAEAPAAGSPPQERQRLLPQSRGSPAGAGMSSGRDIAGMHRSAEGHASSATLRNFPSFFSASRRPSESGFEILPGSPEAGEPDLEAALPWAQAGGASSSSAVLPPSRNQTGSALDSSTEGSETESEAE